MQRYIDNRFQHKVERLNKLEADLHECREAHTEHIALTAHDGAKVRFERMQKELDQLQNSR